MKKLKRILFPFYKEERHSFLKQRWWFRLLTVIYVIALIVTLIIIFSDFTDNSGCYRSLNILHDYGSESYKQGFDECVREGKEAILPGIGLGIGFTLFFHYLFQLLLFKLIINYIILGGKKYEEKIIEGDKTIKDKSNFKLSIPLAVILGCLILGGAFYMIQVNKQKSIEEQKLKEDERQELLFKQKECESLSAGVMKKWNNVVGVTYDEKFWKECVVTYTDTKTGEITTSPLSLMKTVD